MNVGASKPSDAGLYFQWGDTKGYSKEEIDAGKKKFASDWSDYKWRSGNTFTKYDTTGATLDLEDDAANANMGGTWHLPSPRQIQELLDNTRHPWTTQNEVNGRLFTSTKNGKSIFIPAAGNAWDGSIHSSGGSGYVWSSVLYTGSVIGGQYLNVNSGNANLYSNTRCDGLSVRGVLG